MNNSIFDIIEQMNNTPIFKAVKEQQKLALKLPEHSILKQLSWIDNLPNYTKKIWGVGIKQTTISELKTEVETANKPLTTTDIERVIYDLAKREAESVACIVCLLYCFGIITDNDKKKPTAKMIAEKTGFNAETIRKAFERFSNGKKRHSIQISMNKNLKKVQSFAEKNKAKNLLVVDTTPRTK